MARPKLADDAATEYTDESYWTDASVRSSVMSPTPELIQISVNASTPNLVEPPTEPQVSELSRNFPATEQVPTQPIVQPIRVPKKVTKKMAKPKVVEDDVTEYTDESYWTEKTASVQELQPTGPKEEVKSPIEL